MDRHQVESSRRSHAMSPLSPSQVTELIQTCAELLERHRRIEDALADLPESFTAVRAALNELHRIVNDTG